VETYLTPVTITAILSSSLSQKSHSLLASTIRCLFNVDTSNGQDILLYLLKMFSFLFLEISLLFRHIFLKETVFRKFRFFLTKKIIFVFVKFLLCVVLKSRLFSSKCVLRVL
jgi:hypothetical protein